MSKVWQSGQWSLLSLLIIPEMTEEAEKLLHRGEEDKDDEKEVVEEKETVKGGTEMKTDTYDLVILGASGFTGSSLKINIKTPNPRPVCSPVCVQSSERAWNNVGCGRYSLLFWCFTPKNINYLSSSLSSVISSHH